MSGTNAGAAGPASDKPGSKRTGIFGSPGPSSQKQKGSSAAKPSQRSSNASKPWIKEQFTPVEKGAEQGQCKHCNKTLSLKNTTVLKGHLFNSSVCGFLNSAVAAVLAKTEKDNVMSLRYGVCELPSLMCACKS
jgi:hypothetical protein